MMLLGFPSVIAHNWPWKTEDCRDMQLEMRTEKLTGTVRMYASWLPGCLDWLVRRPIVLAGDDLKSDVWRS